MGKVKVGVLVFTDIVKQRILRKNNHFDSIENRGLWKILSELLESYEFCSSATMLDYEYVLVSLCSFYDILNLIANIPKERKQTKIIIGGPGVNNIRPILDYIDVANFGRCDLGKINRIIEGDKLPSVWRKSLDPDFNGQYKVDCSSKDGLANEEASFGCQQKCHFCYYSWWNAYISKDKSGSYSSGTNELPGKEDFITKADFSNHLIVTALDGMTQETRFRVNKKIKTEDVEKALLSINDFDKKGKKTMMKLYSVIGFPWENEHELTKCDLIPICEKLDSKLKNKLIIKFHLSHFIPRQKTPLWNVSFNWTNYRRIADQRRTLFKGEKIELYSGLYNSSPIPAAEETIWQRAANKDKKILRIFTSKKYKNLTLLQKKRFLTHECAHLLREQQKETIVNIKTKYKY